MKGENISTRFLELAVVIMKLIKKLPDDFTGLHIGKQLFRSCTSCGANYEEARASESDADFIHKLKICLKELRESIFWLKLIDKSNILIISQIDNIIMECTELSNIIASSIITVQKRKMK